ncbi:MAG: hypothetical protein B5M53_12160 [Candidatus Cloacimonas sp. 4484_209]|nr:MAG: hypothetical protein B5M53_12160 [Candidatus Cloacimonas sp. 4484_209]
MSESWVIERSRKMRKEEAISYLQNLLQSETERKRKMKENIKWLSRVIKDLKKEIKRRKKEK